MILTDDSFLQLPKGNKRKAINHWHGVNDDPSATIKACPSVHKVPGLKEYAEQENRLHKEAKVAKALAAELEHDAEVERKRAELQAAANSLPNTGNSAKPTRQGRLNFHGTAKRNLDLAVELHIVEDGEVLGLPKKPAFEGVINAAIKYGAATKGDVPYVTPGQKRVREELLVATIQKLESELDSFNEYLRDFGATLAADAKDSVTKDHLMDYITVTPNGFKFEGTADVSGVSRTSEWVASDLVAQLGHLEEELRGKLDDAIETMATKEDTLQEEVDVEKTDNLVSMLEALSIDPGIIKHYVQVITDTPSANAKAWPRIEELIDHIHANPCSFHCVGLFSSTFSTQ